MHDPRQQHVLRHVLWGNWATVQTSKWCHLQHTWAELSPVSSWATNVNSVFLTEAASSNTHSQVFAYLCLSKHETGTVKIWFRRLRMCTYTGACAVAFPGLDAALGGKASKWRTWDSSVYTRALATAYSRCTKGFSMLGFLFSNLLSLL